jgi:hypothetical protein
MSILNLFRASYGEAEFEWHIEAGCFRPLGAQFNSGQVVKRVLTSPQQPHQSIQAALASRNLQYGLGNQAKPAQTGNEG